MNGSIPDSKRRTSESHGILSIAQHKSGSSINIHNTFYEADVNLLFSCNYFSPQLIQNEKNQTFLSIPSAFMNYFLSFPIAPMLSFILSK